jgi:Bacterial capsule synthesis protein PGA_cap
MWLYPLLLAMQLVVTIEPMLGPAVDPRIVIDDAITADHDFVIAVVGDINIARNANASLRVSNDFDAPFVEAAPILQQAALAFGNLESPLFPTCKTLTYSMQFCGDDRGATALATMGIDVVTTVNNHQNDHGAQGRSDTRTTLEANGILVNDDFRVPVIVESHGKKIGFLGFNAIGSGPGWRRHWVKAITTLRPLVDILIGVASIPLCHATIPVTECSTSLVNWPSCWWPLVQTWSSAITPMCCKALSSSTTSR